MTDTFYLTTAIFYPSPGPALHSLFEAIGADALVRYQRLTGKDVRFLTGMDEHSANVERLATERGSEPRALVDEWATSWRAGFDRFDVSYDRFIRTTDADHREASIEMVRRAQASGDIYKGTYAGWYCTGDNEFKTESQIVDGKCPDHPTLELQWLEEENYFFALSKYQAALEELYRTNPSFCEPEHFRNEVLGWLADGLQDFSVSRSGTGWGIPFPGDDAHRIYVWFDALTNYVTGAGFPGDEDAFARWWPADVHVIGKNITRFHCLYWPAMLMSAGLPLPRQVFAHGFMLMKGEKMSKTRGNVLDPDQALATFGVDGVRYLVLREIPFDRDGDVTADGMIRRYNADLANDLGNLVNRTVSMADRYLGGTLPALSGTDAGPAPTDADAELRQVAERAVAAYRAAMERLHFDEALLALSSLTRAANGYAESQAPWALHKAGETDRVAVVLATMGEACRILGHLLAPICPTASSNLLRQVGTPPQYDARGAGGPGLDALLVWGAEAGERHTGPPAPLFPRIEDEPATGVSAAGGAAAEPSTSEAAGS
jgi:methionyl-tRNA synthetase